MLGWPGIRCLVNLSASSHDVVKISSKHTEVHDVITANSTVINDNIPCPESYGIPLRFRSAYVQEGHIQELCTFLTSNFFLPSTLLLLEPSAFLATGASLISTSAMVGIVFEGRIRY